MAPNCRCGSDAIILEVRAATPNRGRWYWRCAANGCSFFQWDESPHPFISHPTEAYQHANTTLGFRLDKDKLPFALRIQKGMDEEFIPLVRSKTRVAFSLVSDSHITIDYSMNSTVLPVIRNIEDIAWNESMSKWVIPATLPAYKTALKTLPVKTPNLQIEIDPIPQAIIQSLLVKPMLTRLNDQIKKEDIFDDNDTMDLEVMDRWSKFVESDLYSQLKDFQREAVKRAIEKKGRLLLANEGGMGKVEEALSIVSAYQSEWPVLVVCPPVMLHTWKDRIEKFFDLDDDEVRILPDVRADIFKPPKAKKRKGKQQAASRKKTKAAQRNVDDENGYEDEDEESVPKQAQFFITSYEVAGRRRNQIKDAKLRIAICDGAQFLKARGNTHNKAFIELLENYPRLVLISDIAGHCLPVDLFTSIKAIRPGLVSTFDQFAKRYCDPKQQVIGWIYNGRSNTEELHYVLEKMVWYNPRITDMAPQLPALIRETIVVPTTPEQKVDTKTKEELSTMEKRSIYMDMYKKTCDAKMSFFKDYLEYTIRSFASMKIAIVWYHEEVVRSLQEQLDAKNIKYSNVNKYDTVERECQYFNTTNRIVFVDMKLKGLNRSCLCTADLVLFNEIPLQKARAREIEYYFRSDERTLPLIIRYLIAPNTLDQTQWPIPDNLEDE